MKILLGIEYSGQPDKLKHSSLGWACRVGQDVRVFLAKDADLTKFSEAVDDVNYEHYVDLQNSDLAVDKVPLDYAKTSGYDLLVMIPSDLERWEAKINDTERNVLELATDLGKGRVYMGKHPKATSFKFNNGTEMVRL